MELERAPRRRGAAEARDRRAPAGIGDDRDFPTLLAAFEETLGDRWTRQTTPPNPLMHWRLFEPLDHLNRRPQGWKVHVSAVLGEAPALFEQVLPLLRDRLYTFKLVADVSSWIKMNSGECGETQIGKIVAIYPHSDEDAHHLALELDRRWAGSIGPVVPSDLQVRVNGAIGLRYGIFFPREAGHPIERDQLEDDAGQAVPDIRSVRGVQPSFAMKAPWAATLHRPKVYQDFKSIEVGPHEFVPTQTFHAGIAKQVFCAYDSRRGVMALVKRVVRGFGHGEGMSDQREALRREFATRQILATAGVAVGRALAIEDGLDCVVAAFEYVDGRSLWALKSDQRRAALPAVAREVARLHAAGFVHGDLKATNVVVDGENVRLIDLETANQIGSVVVDRRTPGYFPPDERFLAMTPAMDRYALGALVASVCAEVDASIFADEPRRMIRLVELNGFAALTPALVRAMAPVADARLPAAALQTALEAISARPAGERRVRAPRGGLRRWAASVAATGASVVAELVVRPRPADAEPRTNSTAPKTARDWREGGLLYGGAGIAFGLLGVGAHLGTDAFAPAITRICDDLAATTPRQTAEPSLFLGQAADALVLAMCGRRFGRDSWRRRAIELILDLQFGAGDLNLALGKAGGMLAAVFVGRYAGAEAGQVAAHLAATLREEAQDHDGLAVWRPTRTVTGHYMAVNNHTFSFGSLGILAALRLHGHLADDPATVAFADAGLARLLDRAVDDQLLRHQFGEDPPVGAGLDYLTHGLIHAAVLADAPEIRTHLACRRVGAALSRRPFDGSYGLFVGAAGDLIAALAEGDRAPTARALALALARRRYGSGRTWRGHNDPEPNPLLDGGLGACLALAQVFSGARSGLLSRDHFDELAGYP